MMMVVMVVVAVVVVVVVVLGWVGIATMLGVIEFLPLYAIADLGLVARLVVVI